jgi:hypothetical protein
LKETPRLIDLKIRIYLKLSKKFDVMTNLFSKVLKISSEPELHNFSNSRDYCGFFQRYEYVEDGQETIYRELSKSLEKIDLPLGFLNWEDKKDYQCLHIRRGDYLLPENSGYGLLSVEWYLRHIKSDLPIVIVTDDKFGASSVLSSFQNCLIFGPDDANPFQALAIMAKSAHFVAANSTLSWWGGFLVAMNGKSVVYPASQVEKHRDINFPLFDIRPGIFE